MNSAFAAYSLFQRAIAYVSLRHQVVTLLQKEEEVYFAEAPKKSKKGRRERKSEKKANFVHSLETLESFATIHVSAPKTAEDVEKCIEVVKTRKEFFNGLPRGADVAAELAKLN